jgi:hypothetical protein
LDKRDEDVLYKDTVYGYPGLIMIGIAGVIVLAAAFIRGAPLQSLITPIVILGGAGLIIARLDIVMTSDKLCWGFTFGAFRRCVAFSEIVSCEPAKVLPLGWGYRIGFKGGRAWIVAGSKVVRLKTTEGQTLIFNANDPADLCKRLARIREVAS